MPTATPSPASVTLPVIEFGCALIVVALAVCMPRIGSGLFPPVERFLGWLARKRGLSVFVAGASACLLRLLLLPFSPIPQPWIHDDFSFLLAGDTFAHGRLTNPTPAMWTHFESFHITMMPSYMSMYFPAQGLFLAAGQVIAGHPWWGVWASCGLMCAALCWMLQGWLPPGWALLGAMLAVLRIASFSYWIDTYSGGAVAALGGALVLGALPRIRRAFRGRDFFWMALGLAILANSRPYEGLLVSLPSLAYLAWLLSKRPHPSAGVLVLRLAPAAALLTATFAFMGYYNYRAFGSPFTLPYTINRATYATSPYFIWQSARPEPVYRHAVMRTFYAAETLQAKTASIAEFFGTVGKRLLTAGAFYLGSMLALPLVMLPRAFRDRRIRLLSGTAAVVAIGLAIETFFVPHYLAPATGLILVFLLQSMRHLRVRGPSGQFLVRAIPAACVFLFVMRIFAQPLHIELPVPFNQRRSWEGGTPSAGMDRAKVAAELESQPGGQLVIVRYPPDHLVPDWVYNAADIDSSKLIWARDMDAASNRELLNYYKGRKVWLVEPDANPPRVTPYSDTSPETAANVPTAKPRP